MIPVADLSRRGAAMATWFAGQAAEVAASGHWLLGPQTSLLESEFTQWVLDHDAQMRPTNAPDVAEATVQTIAVASGASALQLILAGMGVGPGDEVIVPAHTAVPTASAVAAVGATPVPVDVDAATACIDPQAAGHAVTTQTRAVIVVLLYGYPAPAIDLRRPDGAAIPVIIDAAQAHGAVTGHRSVAATAYSFYPTKNLGGIGDGGAVVTADQSLAEAIRQRRVHGMTAQYVHESVSQNFRMSELEAAWLRGCLPTLADGNGRRQQIAATYRAAAPHLNWQATDQRHVYHLCVFRAADRAATRARLAELGVATAIHYPLSIPQQPALLQWARHDCPVAAQWAAECISVPCFPELTDDEVASVAAALAAL
jgi:dTDP-4-amino-4,6-dideoxygalactose transaminase